jgi:hypothetical protein
MGLTKPSPLHEPSLLRGMFCRLPLNAAGPRLPSIRPMCAYGSCAACPPAAFAPPAVTEPSNARQPQDHGLPSQLMPVLLSCALSLAVLVCVP